MPELEDFYRTMLCIRKSEEKLLQLFTSGTVKGTIHLSIGQEACAVGIMNAINPDLDMVFSNHRGHGHALAYGLPLEMFFAEMLGRGSGCSYGLGGSQHIHWKNFISSGVQGGLVPIAVGTAMAEKIKGNKAISIVFIGDGTLGEGVVYEAFNFASKWQIPVLFVLENNGIAQTTRVGDIHAGDISKRAESFAIKSDSVDGNDVIEVHRKASQYVDFIRQHSEPVFLELKTHRLCAHSKSDDPRSSEEVEKLWNFDPVKKLSLQLPDNICKTIAGEIATQINTCAENALNTEPLTIDRYRELKD